MAQGWIDVHTHLNFLEKSVDEALLAMQTAGVMQCITIGTEPKDHEVVLGISKKYFPQVACTLGIHPHEARLYSESVEAELEKSLSLREVVAVGEIGLDFYYENSERSVQEAVFRRQMDLSAKFGLPVEIHTRDAEEETAVVLEAYKGRVQGLLHCFSGSMDLAKRGLDAGFDISFSGIVTFKKADQLREVLKMVPLERMHIETDAPYLAPAPHRGKSNEPAFLPYTAECVAKIKGVDLGEFKNILSNNARRCFPRLAAI